MTNGSSQSLMIYHEAGGEVSVDAHSPGAG